MKIEVFYILADERTPEAEAITKTRDCSPFTQFEIAKS